MAGTLWVALAAGSPALLVAGGSRVDSPAVAAQDSPADRLYRRACGHAARGHLDLALELLAESFGHGLLHPMQAVVDTCLAPLLADSILRADVRDLIHRHAWDEEASMAAPGVPGERLWIAVNLRDENGAPVAGAVVDFGQGTQACPCAAEGEWNPWFFASLRSSDAGQVTVETILPPPAVHGDGRHIHLAVERQGFVPCRGMILLEDTLREGLSDHGCDPGGGVWLAQPVRTEPGRPSYQALLHLSRTP